MKFKLLIESKNFSAIDNNYKQKQLQDKIKIIDLHDNDVTNYFNDISREQKTRVGEIAIINNELAGYIFVTKTGNIQPLYIIDKYRGYGLSNILMKDAIEKYGANKLGVYSDNKIAINLYKKFGFEVVNTKEYKDGDIVLFMERK